MQVLLHLPPTLPCLPPSSPPSVLASTHLSKICVSGSSMALLQPTHLISLPSPTCSSCLLGACCLQPCYQVLPTHLPFLEDPFLTGMGLLPCDLIKPLLTVENRNSTQTSTRTKRKGSVSAHKPRLEQLKRST